MSEEFLNEFEEVYLVFRHKRYRAAVALRSCCSSYAVNVVFGIVRHVVVYDRRDVVDVYASCHDVCCY